MKKQITLLLSILLFVGMCNAQTYTPGTFQGFQTQKMGSKHGNARMVNATSSVTNSSSTPTSGGLTQIYSATGHYTLSADGVGSTNSSMNIRVNKPNTSATVKKAILISAADFTTIANNCVTISGVPVVWNGSAFSQYFDNYWADVTNIVAGQINSLPAGISNLAITECNSGSIDGEALLVVFNDATATEKTIIVMFGAQNPTGDNFSVTLAQPIDPSQTGALLDMGLGIGFSYEQYGGNQRSLISVNGQRISSSAGGEDDGASANGALITVGGIGDTNANPADPFALPTNPRSDDELYSILPFITNTTTNLNITTYNPSGDDNIFLSYFVLSGAAIIGEGAILSQTTTSGNEGTAHTVKMDVKNSNGQPIANKVVSFTITSGPNAGIVAYSTSTDANGVAYLTYTGNGGAGTDIIEACFTNSQNQLTCANPISFQWIVASVPHTISCPASLTVSNTIGQCGASVSYSPAIATGSPTPVITYSAASGSFFPVGATLVTATATNSSGTASCTFTVTVTDNEAPVLHLPAAKTLDCGASILPSNTGMATATDNCTTATSIVITYTDNHSVPVCGGAIIRTWKAVDASNNQTTATQTITVNPATLPTMAALADVTVACGGLPASSMISFSNGLTGGCLVSGTSNSSTFNASPSACGGTVTETWTATDVCNRPIASVSRTITVLPAALPTMTASAAVTISVPCGTSAIPSTLPFTNGLSGDCLISGTSNPSTFTSVVGTCGGTLTETWTATDVCGRALAPVSRTVTVSQNLGDVEPFVLFSGLGAVSNTGPSTVTGDVGSNLGVVSGFGGSTPTYSADAHTTQGKIDLLNLYIHLSNIPVTNSSHAGTFGSGETLTAGVYTIAGAGSIAGNLNLDGQGNANSIFILRVNGAFSPGAGSSITLLNGLRASNVFWIAEGAISIGAGSTMKGSFISHVGAVSMGASGNLEGRLLATVGAVSFGPGTASLPMGLSTIPVICVNSCNSTILGSAAQFALFTTAGAVSNTGTSGIIGSIGSNAGAITGFGTPATTFVGTTYNADGVTALAATDLQAGYNTLVNTPTTNSAHGAVFGSGETLTPGVYAIAGAGSLVGTVTLDGGGDANAKFIIKFGGAFSAAAESKIVLINGTSHCNVFWLSEGAISIGASSFMKGSFIAHNAANSMGANGNLEGSLYSTAGAIGFNTGVGYISYSLCTSPGYVEYSKASPVIIKSETAIIIDSKLSINPNPTRGIINLVTGDASKVSSIEIVDVMGKLVYSAKHYEQTINLSTKAAGVYFIRVNLNSKITTTKIVVEK